MKLFMVIYNSIGLVSGVVGPVPVYDNCMSYIQDASEKMLARPDLEQLTFRCEYYQSRPRLDPKAGK